MDAANCSCCSTDFDPESGARVALIWGEDEVAAQTVTVKSLRERDGGFAGQTTVTMNDLETTLCAALAR